MLHVAVDANCLAWGWGGIPKYVDRIVRELVRGDAVRITLLANTTRDFAEIEGVRQAYRRVKGGTAWRNAWLLPWLLRERPDVFWAPETAMPAYAGVPTVVTAHDLAPVLFPGTKPRRLTLAYRLWLPRSVRRATRVIAISEATAADVERLWHVRPERIDVVPNGVDREFAPGDRSEARDAVRSRWGVGAPFVLHVGTIEPRKGLGVLVEAMRSARAAGRTLRLVFAGAVGYRGGEIVAAASSAGDAVFLGSVSDAELVHLYRAADVLVVPSLYEGFGIPPLEAMACGTPAVVAGDSGGLEETSGPAALVVRARDGHAWLAAIEEATARRDELAEPGIRHAGTFTWPVAASRTLEVLRRAAGR